MRVLPCVHRFERSPVVWGFPPVTPMYFPVQRHALMGDWHLCPVHVCVLLCVRVCESALQWVGTLSRMSSALCPVKHSRFPVTAE